MRWVVVDSGGCNSPVDPVSRSARAPYIVVIFESVIVVVVFESGVVVVFKSVVVVVRLRWRRR